MTTESIKAENIRVYQNLEVQDVAHDQVVLTGSVTLLLVIKG